MTTKIEDTNFVFGWDAGVLTRLNGTHQKKINRKKRVCASCGEHTHLEFERLSGGQKSYFCEECGRKYVKSAKKIEEERKRFSLTV